MVPLFIHTTNPRNQREGNRYHCRFRGGTDIPRVFGSGNQYHRETLFTVTPESTDHILRDAFQHSTVLAGADWCNTQASSDE